MNNTFLIVYIDDNIDIALSSFLDRFVDVSEEMNITYEEITFEPTHTYSDLINNSIVKLANLIIIDSKLFENKKAIKKFSGEEFKVILKKHNPFIEVLVITQNIPDEGLGTISKYSKSAQLPHEYYSEHLTKKISEAMKEVQRNRNLVDKIESDSFIKQQFEDLVNGIPPEYSGITTEDIDELVGIFRKIEAKINNE